MNNFKSLIQSATKATANLISQQYEKNKQEQLEMQKLNRLRICEQATQDYINQIHPELAYIFRQTSISRLQPIQHPGDLLKNEPGNLIYN